MTVKSVKKVTFNLPEELLQFLQNQAAKEHITVTDVLRRSINAERFLVQQENAGYKVLVEGDGRQLREIVRR